jgi:hypothetical protein
MTVLLRSRGSVPISPTAASINDSGAAAMVLQRLDFTRGVYLARPNGSLTPIVAEGDPAPGGGSFTSDLEAPSINATNKVAFFGGFGLGSGIFIAGPKGAITKVVNNTTEVPNHPGAAFFTFGSIHLTDDDTAIFFQGNYVLNGTIFSALYQKV